MDFLVEPAQDECHNPDDIQHHEVPGSFNLKSTFQLALSKSNHVEIDSALPSYSDKLTANEDQPMTEVTNSDDEQPGLWETKVDYRSNSPKASSRRGSKICSEPSSSSNDHRLIEMEMCQNKDTTETQNNSPAKRAHCGNDSGDQSVFNSKKVSLKSNDSVKKLNNESCSGDAVLISEISSTGSNFPLIKDCVQNDLTFAVNISNKSLAPYQKENTNDQYMSTVNEKENTVNLSNESSSLNKDIELDPSKIKLSLQRYLSADNVSDKLVSDGKLQRYLSADNVNCDMEPQIEEKLTAERYLETDNCQPVVHSEDSYQSTETISIHTSDLPPQYSLKNSHISATVVQSSSKSPDFNQSASVHEMCNSSSDKYESSPVTKLKFPFTATKAVNKSDESDYSMSDTGESDYKQLMEEYKSTTEYQATVSCNSYQSTLVENESCYKQADQNNTSNYNQKNNDINLTSYKQSGVDDMGDMDTETLDEEDGTHATDGPGIYQSYEEGIISPHYQNAALNALVGLPVVAEYNTVPNSDNKWTSASSSNIEQDVASTSNSECSKGESYNSSTYPATQNTHTELSMSSSKNTSSPTLATSSQAQPLGPTSEDDHEGALCTGDQSFKTAAARQSALVPFMQTSRSMPFVPNINPSMYAGTAMVQGMNGPTIMSSSSVHIAQHPGGATIMRHQTVSAGLNGGITQATLMQQQAMSNGAQATAVLQQRTLTNRGQTMVLQQRTMTTGLGGMTQQTLVQQRMAAPNSVAQAMYHANAMRQRAIVNQQATMLQHRAIRLAQARVMSSQLLRAQALSGAAFLQQAGPGNPTSIIGPSLVRGGTPGSVMQQLVRQRYLGGPVMPGRGVQMVAGRPVRVKVTYTRGSLPMESNT